MVPTYNHLFGDHVRDANDGSILVPRTQVRMTEINRTSVVDQVDALENQRLISNSQTINANLEPQDWNFFTFDDEVYHTLFGNSTRNLHKSWY
mmetsp:Transcript_23584/g.57815  ORF Transcript_23584/g.57815 Transcript_23584/m.57815 type:complete len:93 (-) Transcript_23584:1271-1549(-)